MANEIRLTVVTTADNAGLVKSATAMKTLDGETNKLTKSTENLRDSWHRGKLEAFDLNREIEHSRSEIRRLNNEFSRTGDVSLTRDIRRHKSALSQLTRLRKDLEEAVLDAIPKSGHGISIPVGIRPVAIGALVAVVAESLPAIGAMVSGAVVGAVGIGGIVGGVFAASRSPLLRQSAQDVVHSIAAEFFRAGSTMVGPVINALHILERDFKELDLGKTFAMAAPAVEILAAGIGRLVKNFMPGFNAVMARSPEIMTKIADGLGRLGSALSDMLIILLNSKGTMEGLELIFELTAIVVRGLARLLGGLGDAFHGTSVFVAELTGAVEDLPLGPVAALARNVNNLAENITGVGEGALRSIGYVYGSAVQAGRGTEYAAKSMEDYQKAIDAANRALDDFINKSIALDSANLAVEQGLLELKKTLKENGHHWETNTEKGLANRRALLDQVDALERHREAEIASGVSTDRANREFNTQIQRLYDIARRAGASKDVLEHLAKTYHISVVTKYTSYGTPPSAVARQRGTLDEGSMARRASGGPVMGPGAYLVGDAGRAEVLTLASGMRGHVWPSINAYNAALRSKGAGAAHMTVLTINFNGVVGNAREVGRQVVEAIEAYEQGNTSRWRS